MRIFTKCVMFGALIFSCSTANAARLLPFEGADIDINNSHIRPTDGSGSWFAIETVPGQFTHTSFSSYNGLELNGSAQLASGAHFDPVDGTENPNIDNPWTFFNGTGMHMTTSPVNVISRTSNTLQVDLSGLAVIWGSHTVGLGAAAWGSNTDGIGLITCEYNCNGIGILGNENYTLSYTATVLGGAFEGLRYEMHLERTAVVPVPAAIWMFIPGVVGLFSLARRKA